MIQAAAACATDEGPPPPELTLAWQCAQYHTLPHVGGLSEQPAGLLLRMTAALNVYNAIAGYTQAPYKSEWVSRNPADWKIVQEVIKNGQLHA